MMNFELTDEQKEVKNAAREFAEKEFSRELALECEEQGRFPHGLWKKAADLGFIGINIPEEYGGQGMGLLEKVLVLEEFFRADPSLGFIYITTFGSELILNNGTEEQKKKYITPIARGEAMMGMAVTEPEHGSDILKLDTVAVKDGDEWVINGTKTFISNGPVADWLVVVCQTDPEAKPPYRGQSMFIVETNCDGFEAVELKGKMGMHLIKTSELYFNDVRVPAENLLGEENKGFYQLLGMLNETRTGLAARCIGIAQGALERSVRYARQRKQFGRPIIEFQAIRHKLAEMATKVEAARLLTYQAAWFFDQGKPDPMLTSMAKYYASRTAVEVSNDAIQVHGGYGYFAEYDVERCFRNARIAEITEGTSEIQKNTIASMLKKRIR